jgi:tetratricopeptide (TPR) repeat protein
MFNLLLALTAGILIGWNFHSFFKALTPPKILRDDFNLSQKTALSKVESNTTIETKELNTTIKKPLSLPISFEMQLKKNLFSDAMRVYQESEEERKVVYREELERFFHDKIMLHPKEATVQLKEYIDIEPNNQKSQQQLVELYQQEKAYDKAIAIVMELLNHSNSAVEQEQYHKEIIRISQIYIDTLIKEEKFQQLIAFLEKQMEYEFGTTFYTFTLAKHYSDTKEYPLAKKLLKEIEFDEEYGERAKALLKKIENQESVKEEYNYQFPLIKEGEQFLLEVTIDDTPLKLLLDTGSSYTLIDETKLPSLTIIDDEVTLQTPAGAITSKLQETQIFKIKDLELKSFKVVTTPFKQQGADGLLGMNFFKQFKFKIDQEKGVLYLHNKN